MSLLVVGTVAYDTIETPAGRVEEALGGSAAYFSLAASVFSPVSIVAVVGEDYDRSRLKPFEAKGIDLSGLQTAPGKTFRWTGKYLADDLNEAKTLDTQLNVLLDFDPQLTEAQKKSKFVFLANIDPKIQHKVLDQVEAPEFVALDTMNFWIDSALDELKSVLKRIDMLVINEGEAYLLGGAKNIVSAANAILALGPRILVIKRGEYGALLFAPTGAFASPALPLDEVIDPTGAGDSFAGGLMGFIASIGRHDSDALRQGIVYGSSCASYCVESFSMERLLQIDRAAVDSRYSTFLELTYFPALEGTRR